jgi:Icc protein
MMKLAWLTDLHLEFVRDERTLATLAASVRATEPAAVLVGGDTGTAITMERHLRWLAGELKVPVFFVMGNHDYYHGSIEGSRKIAARLSRDVPHLHWLDESGVVPLTGKSALIGHGGWADGRLGNGPKSPVMLNDYVLIEDFQRLGPEERFRMMARLGDEAAAHFQKWLPAALDAYQQVILLTHVPPFRAACWHEGRISDDDWLPHFASRAPGEVLREIMATQPDKHLTVLCGHTHSSGICRVLPNLTVKTGMAHYGSPQLQEVLVVE